MRVKTDELSGTALDWAVAKCEGVVNGDALDIGFIKEGGYTPSTDWAQGGQIIERERICVSTADLNTWSAWVYDEVVRPKPNTVYGAYSHHRQVVWVELGPTPLIAAMRCYVAIKLGDEGKFGKEVEVPEHLRSFIK